MQEYIKLLKILIISLILLPALISPALAKNCEFTEVLDTVPSQARHSDSAYWQKEIRDYPQIYYTILVNYYKLKQSIAFLPPEDTKRYRKSDINTIIKETQLPIPFFNNLNIYILPLRLESYLAITKHDKIPDGEVDIYISSPHKVNEIPLEVFLTHELGHYIHFNYLGNYEDNPDAWQEFLDIIGQDEYKDNDSPYWERTDEIFAEYFRIVFGSAKAREGLDFMGSALNPADDEELSKRYHELVINYCHLINNNE